jgi:hypothetical protein
VNYGVFAKPLTQLLKQKQFSWTTDAQENFISHKAAMCSLSVLTQPNFDGNFEIESDACDKGVGAVLSQKGSLIAFF